MKEKEFIYLFIIQIPYVQNLLKKEKVKRDNFKGSTFLCSFYVLCF